MKNKQVYIIIVAAGTGSRFGAERPKQFCMLDSEPVLCHTVRHLLEAVPEAHIITVVSHSMVDYWQELAEKYGTPAGRIVEGGATRWESVRNALDTIPVDGDDTIVLVHDGARPLVDSDTVRRVIEATSHGRSAVPVVLVTDSLRLVAADGRSVAVNRSDYRAVVTPQGFMASDLKEAYRLPFTPSFTDDASVMAAAGFSDTVLVESKPSNIKITNPGDLALASWYLNHRS